MASMPKTRQIFIMMNCWLGGFGCCLLLLHIITPKCSSPPVPVYKPQTPNKSVNITTAMSTVNPKEKDSKESNTVKEDKPILLMWVWPENFRFNLSDCKTIFNIDECIVTDDRNLYNEADNVLIFHKSIRHDLSNLPKSPRPAFQRWIWFHVESPTNTARISGLENLFNLTLTYRRDSDIAVRYWLKINKTESADFEIPKKDKLVCWFVTNTNPGTGTGTRMKFYNEFKKHIDITVFGGMVGARLPIEKYYSTMASCKFYLSFENSIHKDYFTEKVNGPLSSGTVPVVLGRPRQNYEDFYPPDSFIHVNDFSTPEELAKHLLQLDKDDAAYRRYFNWRKHVYPTPHLLIYYQEFIIYICHACQYVGRHREYKAAHDIYKWWFE